MSDDTETPATEPAETEATRRERRSFPIRALRQTDGGFTFISGLPAWQTIEAAEAWVRANGEDNATYLLCRPIGLRRVTPRSITVVEL